MVYVVPLHSTWIEITSPGPGMYRDGRRFYAVDIVEANGGRGMMWGGSDLDEARRAARECAEDCDGRTVPIRGLTGAAP